MIRALAFLVVGLLVVFSIFLALLDRDTYELGRGEPDATLVLASPPPDPCFDYQHLEDGTAERTRQHHFNHLDAKGYARWRIACVHGWGTREWECLEKLWTRESDWHHLARNRDSGAYGIPQAVPGSKMRVRGEDWRHNPRTQVRWGTSDYIAARYGTPCQAWQHFDRKGWY